MKLPTGGSIGAIKPTRANRIMAISMVAFGALTIAISISVSVWLMRAEAAAAASPAADHSQVQASVTELRRVTSFAVAMGIVTVVAGGIMLRKAKTR